MWPGGLWRDADFRKLWAGAAVSGLGDAVTGLAGSLAVFGDAVTFSFLPLLVGRARVLEGNAKLAVQGAVVSVAGPGLAGALIQLVTAPVAILADAFSFVLGALCWSRLRELELVEDAAARGWPREVERHRCTAARIEQLLSALGQPVEGSAARPAEHDVPCQRAELS